MNKKILGMATILLTVAMVATPLMATVQAEKTIVPFVQTGIKLVPTVVVEGDEKWSGDGHVRISTGTQRESACNGILGTGMEYSEGIVSVTDMENSMVFHGHGIYEWRLVISSGPYGAGTLEGIGIMEFDCDLTETPMRYEIWGNVTLKHGTGDLEGVKMNWDFYQRYVSLTKVSFKNWGEIILP